ncbi:Luciferin 4-monooxygenase [Gryllus bimaculatus]|nr:Luciferin 4-monooxygenase [Gryllus bimaculatus]
MGPAEECDDAPPEALEDGELRGPMDGYPRVSDCLARPLAQRLMEGLQARGDDVIQVYPREGVSWTARQVLQRGLQLAAGMQMLGVKPGDYVTLVGGRHPEYGPLLIATLVAGAAWAPLNHTFDDGDLRLLLGILEPRLVLAEREVADRLRPLLAELQSPSTLAVLCEGEEWAALATDAAPDTWPPLPPPPADPRSAIAVVACSSGTSGLPKACHSSHFAVFGALSIFTRDETLDGISDTMVLTSPGFWVTGIWFTLLTMVHRTRLVYEYGCDEHQFLEAIETNRPPVIFTANNFLLSVAKVHEASKPRRDLSSLHSMLTGGAAMSRQAEEFVGSIMGWVNTTATLLNAPSHKRHTLHRYVFPSPRFCVCVTRVPRKFVCTLLQVCVNPSTCLQTVSLKSSCRLLVKGIKEYVCKRSVRVVRRAEVFNMYGMTELNGGIGMTKRSQYKPGSVGTLSALLRCRVVDAATERVCGPNEEGELRFKGPMLAQGYLKNPQASAELFDATGWLRTGDLGHYDEDGFFYITGRIKDTLKYRGVHEHPAVHESAVVGVPDPVEQELPRAYVVLRPGASATEEELCRFVQASQGSVRSEVKWMWMCLERVAPHKWLRGGVVFLKELPKTTTGKISRAAIRKQFVLQQS